MNKGVYAIHSYPLSYVPQPGQSLPSNVLYGLLSYPQPTTVSTHIFGFSCGKGIEKTYESLCFFISSFLSSDHKKIIYSVLS